MSSPCQRAREADAHACACACAHDTPLQPLATEKTELRLTLLDLHLRVSHEPAPRTPNLTLPLSYVLNLTTNVLYWHAAFDGLVSTPAARDTLARLHVELAVAADLVSIAEADAELFVVQNFPAAAAAAAFDLDSRNAG